MFSVFETGEWPLSAKGSRCVFRPLVIFPLTVDFLRYRLGGVSPTGDDARP